jgi:CubicO group peptidase (beta-lactamase class C family)
MEYSNAGVGLLGQVLARAAGADFETVLHDRVTGPLALPNTLATLDPDHAAAFVPGRVDEVEVEYQNLAALSPAGGFVSSTRDMARYLQFQTGALTGPLDAALARGQTPLHPVGENMEIAYNWFVQTAPRYVFHDGAVPGHSTQVIFGPENDLGVVFLSASNTYAVYPLTNFALARLAGVDVPAPEPPAEGALDPARLDEYTGTFIVRPGLRFFVTRTESHLYFRLSGQNELRLYPDADADDAFYLRVVLARVTFERDETGTVTRCILHQNGQTIRATR